MGVAELGECELLHKLTQAQNWGCHAVVNPGRPGSPPDSLYFAPAQLAATLAHQDPLWRYRPGPFASQPRN